MIRIPSKQRRGERAGKGGSESPIVNPDISEIPSLNDKDPRMNED